MLTRSDLHSYQDTIVSFVEKHRCCALWVDLGLGKTVSTLTAVADLIDGFEIKSVLVVAPLRVARDVWPLEVKKWAHTKHLTVAPMIGSAKERLRALRSTADIHVINVDNLCWLEGQLGIGKVPWDMVVIDEASGFKDRNTLRFKTMRRIARVADRVVELTATPTPNSLVEAWPQFYLLDGGQRLGPSVTHFRQKYFVQPNPTVNKWLPKKGAPEVIQDLIRDITITLKAEDYLKMPEKIMRTVDIHLSTEEMASYETMERDFVLSITDDTDIEAISASALATKLLQLANGQVYDGDRVVHEIHGRKIEALKELREEANGEPLLVAYAFQSDLARLQKEFPDAETLNSKNAIERWNRGEISMLLVHPASAGHGLNLQYGGRHLVWYGLTWSLELYLQLIGRLHRQGQTKPVIVHHLITKGTIDEIVMRVLSGKNATQEALLQAMKKHVEDIR